MDCSEKKIQFRIMIQTSNLVFLFKLSRIWFKNLLFFYIIKQFVFIDDLWPRRLHIFIQHCALKSLSHFKNYPFEVLGFANELRDTV